MEGGADVNLPATSGASPLLLAMRAGHMEVAKYLFGMGAADPLAKVCRSHPVERHPANLRASKNRVFTFSETLTEQVSGSLI